MAAAASSAKGSKKDTHDEKAAKPAQDRDERKDKV